MSGLYLKTIYGIMKGKKEIIKKVQKVFFFFQAEVGIRDLVRSRGLGDEYKRRLEGVVPGAGQAGDVTELLTLTHI